MHNSVNPRLTLLYQKALICQVFPAYRLEELDETSLVDLLQALELLDTARKVKS